MNRREFMNRLEQLLQGISEEERKDALQYYEDYFDDAGMENEQDVIRNLGSPEDVAKSIWDEAQQAQWSHSGGTEYSYSAEATDTDPDDSNYYSDNITTGEYNYNSAGSNEFHYQQSQNANYNTEQNSKNKDRNLILIIILIVTAPITLPIIFSVISTIFSFFMGIVGCIIGFPIAAVALFIVAAALIINGLTGFGLVCMGISFGFLCAEFLLIPLFRWICGTAIPGIYKWAKCEITKLRNKGGNN